MSVADIMEELPKLSPEEREQILLRIYQLLDDTAPDVLITPEVISAIGEARNDPRPRTSLDEVKRRFLG